MGPITNTANGVLLFLYDRGVLGRRGLLGVLEKALLRLVPSRATLHAWRLLWYCAQQEGIVPRLEMAEMRRRYVCEA